MAPNYVVAPNPRYSGTMTSVKDAWGFVKIASLQQDVFLGLLENPHLPTLPAVGDKLSFELRVDSKSGRYKAVSVAPSPKGPRVQGTVTEVQGGGSWGWGSTTSKGVEGVVMFGKRNLIA